MKPVPFNAVSARKYQAAKSALRQAVAEVVVTDTEVPEDMADMIRRA